MARGMSSADKRALLALEAARRVADVRDDPHGRRALAEESYLSATNASLDDVCRGFRHNLSHQTAEHP